MNGGYDHNEFWVSKHLTLLHRLILTGTKKLKEEWYHLLIEERVGTKLFLLKIALRYRCPSHEIKTGLKWHVKLLFTYFAFKRIQIASITVMTRSGGLVKTLISEMSALSKESRALLAASKAGRASSKSRWASSAIACVSSALTFATASSSWTIRRT